MRSCARLLLAIAAFGLAAGPALAADPAEGVWLTQAKDAKVRIAPCPAHADQLCGDIVWLAAPRDETGQPKHDAHNPDAKLRSPPADGLTMIRDFHRRRRRALGRRQDLRPALRQGPTIRRCGPSGDGVLKVDGCVMMFCQTQTWTKAAS